MIHAQLSKNRWSLSNVTLIRFILSTQCSNTRYAEGRHQDEREKVLFRDVRLEAQ